METPLCHQHYDESTILTLHAHMERSDRVGCCETQCKEQNKKNFVKELWIYGEPDNVYMHLVQVKLVVDISDDILPFLLIYSYAGVKQRQNDIEIVLQNQHFILQETY
ncbi:uncharacterized protein EAF02_009262 [Botrytis sinoallii]|uniref:uncharacterized protein n=1 Tax=Botrytis sinoallii TaxID=1463999 RepID=UPI001902BBA2|nr:uncharacterized protein EAF02_009262 [Botrytis sinoallii]KAF7870072.1 hypothetical protein EAF02_009262 [Botrytis sinoallii]